MRVRKGFKWRRDGARGQGEGRGEGGGEHLGVQVSDVEAVVRIAQPLRERSLETDSVRERYTLHLVRWCIERDGHRIHQHMGLGGRHTGAPSSSSPDMYAISLSIFIFSSPFPAEGLFLHILRPDLAPAFPPPLRSSSDELGPVYCPRAEEISISSGCETVAAAIRSITARIANCAVIRKAGF